MGALFDLSFKKFVSPLIAKVVYVLGGIGIVFAYLGAVIAAFGQNAAMGILTLLILGPLFGLLALAYLRVILESLVAMIVTAQNTGELVRLQGGQPHSETSREA